MDVTKAEEYARNVLGIKNVSYKGVDIVTANEWNRGLVETFSKFPELKKRINFAGTCQGKNALIENIYRKLYTDAYIKANPNVPVKNLESKIEKSVEEEMKKFCISPTLFADSFFPNNQYLIPAHGITVNAEFGKDSKKFIEILEKAVKNKITPIGCGTIRGLLDHEIGQQLDYLLGIRDIPEIKELFDNRTKEELTNDLSIYSWKNNNQNIYAEMIAEAWSEYCNNPYPREIAKVVGETIERLYIINVGENCYD